MSRVDGISIGVIKHIQSEAKKAENIGEWKRILREFGTYYGITDMEIIAISKLDLGVLSEK